LARVAYGAGKSRCALLLDRMASVAAFALAVDAEVKRNAVGAVWFRVSAFPVMVGVAE
jgi:hypothetical protein